MWWFIPKGRYCYIPISINGQTGRMKTKKCKWWKHLGTWEFSDEECEPEDSQVRTIRCEYLDFTDYYEKTLLWDQCKECNTRLDLKGDL